MGYAVSWRLTRLGDPGVAAKATNGRRRRLHRVADEPEPPDEPVEDVPVVRVFASDSGAGVDAATVTRHVSASDEARADDSASLAVAFTANLNMTATLDVEDRIEVGGVVGVLAEDPDRVDSMVDHLDTETVDELWTLLRQSAEAVAPRMSDEERWRQLHILWEQENADRIVGPALDAVLDQIRALHAEIEALSGTVAKANTSVPRPEKSRVKRWGAILTLWLGSYLAGGSVSAALTGDTAHMVDYTVALGAIVAVADLYDRCVD